MINRKAVFADETQCFKTPYEPQSGDTVTLRIRTLANDVLKVYAVINGIKRLMKNAGKAISIIIRYLSSVRLNPSDITLYYTTMTTRLLIIVWAVSKTCSLNTIFLSLQVSKFPIGRKAPYFIRYSATDSATENLRTTSKITSTIIRADIPKNNGVEQISRRFGRTLFLRRGFAGGQAETRLFTGLGSRGDLLQSAVRFAV